jgi:hypothetical protein
MSVTRPPDAGEIANALKSLAKCRQALPRGKVWEAASCLQEFRSSTVGQTVRQLESDLLELRIAALQDTNSRAENGDELISHADRLFLRHVGKNNEDAYLAGAAEIIRRHVSPQRSLAWLEVKCPPRDMLAKGRGRTLALYLKLLRQEGRLDEARGLADEFLNERQIRNPHRRLWEESLLTLRGQQAKGRAALLARIEQAATGISARGRLELLNMASASRILVASATPIGGEAEDTAREQRLALDLHRLQATLNAREQRFAQAAGHLRQAREISASLRGETLETLGLDLQQFQMLLQNGSVNPTDRTWLEHLRGIAASVGRTVYLEYRLANVWRRAGLMSLAQAQYAAVADRYPRDRHGIRASYQLAVLAEEAGDLDSAYARYANIASLGETKPSVAALALVGAFRCAAKRNDETLKRRLIENLRDYTATIPDLRLASFTVRRLREDGLGGLADALLDQCLNRYQAIKNSVNAHKYLELTHHFVRRLYEARRYRESLDLINSIDASYWGNARIHWEHLAGCLHYGCLCWLALGDPQKGVDFAASKPTPLRTRPHQAAHVDLAIARVCERTSPRAVAHTIYNRIIAETPFSRAAMKARVQLAKQAWDRGDREEARQWAMGVLIDGKVNRKDPDLAAAYWSAYSMAATRQGATLEGDEVVYPDLSSEQAMKRQRWGATLRRTGDSQ